MKDREFFITRNTDAMYAPPPKNRPFEINLALPTSISSLKPFGSVTRRQAVKFQGAYRGTSLT